MAAPAAPAALPAHAAARAIAARELTSEELVQACLDRIAEREDAVGAWEQLDPEAALAQARARDAERPRGPLHGVPVGVKDVIDTRDLPTGYGSPIRAGHRPVADAPCVMRLRAAGAVILGKTVTTEFAMWTPGRTANPHDHRRTPGGSSSGSAAAVADGMVPVALGTQTAGSIAAPPAFCGVLGLKPSHGLLPTTGVMPLSPRLDTLGVLARDAEDLALVAEVIAGAALGGARVAGAPALALARTPWWEQADEHGQAALLEAAARLRSAGATVTEVSLPEPFAGLPEAHDTLMAFDAARALAPEREEHAGRISPRVREYLERGAGIDPVRRRRRGRARGALPRRAHGGAGGP